MSDKVIPTQRGKALELPADTAKKYRFTMPIYGGPVFDFPAFNMTGINLAALTEQQAERLVRKGWAGIERVQSDAVVSRVAASAIRDEKKGE